MANLMRFVISKLPLTPSHGNFEYTNLRSSEKTEKEIAYM